MPKSEIPDGRACLSQSDIERLARGRMEPAEAALAQEHVLDCLVCAAALDQLLQPVAEVLRMYAPLGSSPEEAAAQEIVSRLEGLMPAIGDLSTSSDGQADSASGEPARDATSACLPAGMPPAAEAIGRLGPYRVVRLLGEGGMGRVYASEDLDLGRAVALKVIKVEEVSARSRERFKREARAAAALHHDNVVPIWQVGEDHGVLYLAMPLLPGESLAGRLKRQGRLPVAEVREIGRQAALGLQAAHAKGLIHRDIKPGNLWLEEQPGAGFRVRLLDFGLARWDGGSQEPLSREGTLLGTPQYMAPEQARAEAVDARADLFSLGCVLYECLTGRRPFDGSHTLSVLAALESREPKPPHELGAEVPREFSDLVMQLLQKERNKRPASAAEMIEMLNRLAQPGAARKPTGRWLGIGLLLAGLAALVLGGVVILVKGVRLEVPDGSTVTVDKAGNITVETPIVKPAVVTNKGSAATPVGTIPVEEVLRFPSRKEGLDTVNCLELSPDGKLVLAGTERDVRLFELAAGKQVHAFPFVRATAVAFSPDGAKALYAISRKDVDGWKRIVVLWEVATGKEIREIEIPPVLPGYKDVADQVGGLAFSPDGTTFLSSPNLSGPDLVQAKGELLLWDAATGKLLRRFAGFRGGVLGMAWHPDGTRIFGSGAYDTLRIWDAASGRGLRVAGDDFGSWGSCAISPDRKTVAVGDRNALSGRIRVMDADSGKLLQEWRSSFQNLQDGLHDVQYSPDGELVGVAGFGGWELVDARSHLQRARLKQEGVHVYNLRFTENGNYTITGGEGDRPLRLWNLKRPPKQGK